MCALWMFGPQRSGLRGRFRVSERDAFLFMAEDQCWRCLVKVDCHDMSLLLATWCFNEGVGSLSFRIRERILSTVVEAALHNYPA
jgi:hypothetical protein